MDYISVEQAVETPGLRLVLSAGVPGPWGESAKAILHYKQLAFVAVHQQPGGDNEALQAWTGQTAAPVLVNDGQAPICHWLDLLMATEQLAPNKPLLPQDALDRARVLGLSALIAGVDGFAWNRRLQMLAPMMGLDPVPEMAARLAAKYGYSDAAFGQSTAKIQAITQALNEQLARQAQAGSAYFIGDSVSAVDFYWANFVGMVVPLGPEDNPMPQWMRATYENADEQTRACITPALLAHRDHMYQHFISLPLDF